MTEKKIEKLSIWNITTKDPRWYDTELGKSIAAIEDKINEIIDKVNQLNVPFYLEEEGDP